MPTLPFLLIWIGLWCAASLTYHVIGSDAHCQGLLVEEGGCATATGQPQTSTTQISCRRVQKQVVEATQQLHHPGELIYFLLVSPASADFSCKQAITSLLGKGDERLGDRSGCLLGSMWRGL